MNFNDFVSTVKSVTGSEPRQNSDWYTCRCPAHKDKTPSFAFKAGDRAIVVKCHAGCSSEEICKALGLRMADLFYDPLPPSASRVANFPPPKHHAVNGSDRINGSALAVAGGEKKKKSASDEIRDAVEGCITELWNANGKAYATVDLMDVYADRDTKGRNVFKYLPIRGGEFERWVRQIFDRECGATPDSNAINNAVSQWEAMAFHGTDYSDIIASRIGGDGKEMIFIDPCASDQSIVKNGWNIVKIVHDGWKIVPANDWSDWARFVPHRESKPLPLPESGGSLRELKDIFGIQTEKSYVLIAAWLLAAFRKDVPCPILVLNGEQGTGKTTISKMLCGLIDPREVSVLCPPKDEDQLAIAAVNSVVLACDNLSGISGEFSDALCRLCTGGGLMKRKLYTDGETVSFGGCRPIIVNGIDALGSRGDLLDRSLPIGLDPIPPEQRKTEDELWAAFLKARPRLLGAIYTALAVGLRELPHVELDTKPRMADFALFAAAAQPAYESDVIFESAYAEIRGELQAAAIDSSPFATAIITLMQGRQAWRGSATQLMNELSLNLDGKTPPGWPKIPSKVSVALRRAAPALRAAAITWHTTRSDVSRTIEIQKAEAPNE